MEGKQRNRELKVKALLKWPAAKLNPQLTLEPAGAKGADGGAEGLAEHTRKQKLALLCVGN